MLNPFLLQGARNSFLKSAFAPPAGGTPPGPPPGAPPGMDPAMADPAMMGGAPPAAPEGVPPVADPAMMGGGPAATPPAGGLPPAAPPAGGAPAPQADPLSNISGLIDERIRAALQQQGAGGSEGGGGAGGGKPKAAKPDLNVMAEQVSRLEKLMVTLTEAAGIPLPYNILDNQSPAGGQPQQKASTR